MSTLSNIEQWWQNNPMTYGEVHGQAGYQNEKYELGTLEFFQRLDAEFYSWNKPLHDQRPFDRLFPYERYKSKKILEVGCGLGTMLMNWAYNGANCTGVDLNKTSVTQTRRRFELFNLNGDIREADAHRLPFDAETFDYGYSWGVLHHSPDLPGSIAELFRVLKSGSEFGIMLYNRQSLYQWYINDFIEGFLHEEHRWLNPVEFNSRYGDGHKEDGNPHTWPVTKQEMLDLIQPYAGNVSVKVLGTDLDFSLRLLFPGVSKFLPLFLKKALARRLGWSLWISGQKD